MIFRLTQRLSRKINAGSLPSMPLDENPYADWSARLFTADRTQYILISHTRSLYSVLMYGRGITNDSAFTARALDNMRQAMMADGLGLIYMNFIAPASASVRFAKALNRSVTGSMNELQANAKVYLDTGEWGPDQVGFYINQTFLSAIGGLGTDGFAMPREAFTSMKR